MLRRSDGYPWIKSYAHGGAEYTLVSGGNPDPFEIFGIEAGSGKRVTNGSAAAVDKPKPRESISVPEQNNDATEAPESDAWINQVMRNRNGPLSNVANALLALRNDPTLRNAFAYDEMLCVSVLRDPKRGLRPLRDADITATQSPSGRDWQPLARTRSTKRSRSECASALFIQCATG